MRIKHIEALHAIMTEGSITAAAKVLSVSQPALSMTIRQAEDQLQYPLFFRSKAGLVPTPEAQRLYEQSKDIMNSLRRVQALSQNLRKTSDMVVRVGTVPSLALEVVPRAITQYLKIYPQLKFTMTAISTKAAREALIQDHIDIAVVFGHAEWQGCQSIKIGTGHVVMASPAEMALPNEVQLQNINDLRIADIADSGPVGTHIATAFEQNNISVTNSITIDTYHSAAHFVKAGHSSAVIDQFSARAMKQDAIKISLITDISPFDVSVMLQETSAKTEALYEFIEELKITSSQPAL